MAGALDAIVTGRDTYAMLVEQRLGRQSHPADPDPDPAFCDELRSVLAAVPESELERRRRVSDRAPLRVTDTHPPARLRASMLRGLPAGDAAVSLTAEQADKIRAELAGDYARIGAQLSRGEQREPVPDRY